MDLAQVQEHLVGLDHLMQNAGQQLRMLDQTVGMIKEQRSQQDDDILQALKESLVDLNRLALEVKKVRENEMAIKDDLAELRKLAEAYEG